MSTKNRAHQLVLCKSMQISQFGAFSYLKAERYDCLKLSVCDAFIIGDCSLCELCIRYVRRSGVGSPYPGLAPAYSFHATSELHM